jgi:hypothetical protein
MEAAKENNKHYQIILFTHVYCGIIHNSQLMETAKMPHH